MPPDVSLNSTVRPWESPSPTSAPSQYLGYPFGKLSVPDTRERPIGASPYRISANTWSYRCQVDHLRCWTFGSYTRPTTFADLLFAMLGIYSGSTGTFWDNLLILCRSHRVYPPFGVFVSREFQQSLDSGGTFELPWHTSVASRLSWPRQSLVQFIARVVLSGLLSSFCLIYLCPSSSLHICLL